LPAGLRRVNRGALRYADAIAAGRLGHRRQAEEAFVAGDQELSGVPYWHRLLRLFTCECALTDGWGDPVPLLRVDLSTPERDGDDPQARICRDLLRRAGAPTRKGRGDSNVPSALRALGVTATDAGGGRPAARQTAGGVSQWRRCELGPTWRHRPRLPGRPKPTWFESALAPALASVPEIDSVLRVPGTRIADIGCGAGWSTIALARAYPSAAVLGVDVDEPSIEAATANAEATGVADRANFTVARGETLGELGPFDAAFAFECVHDMPQPVEVLAAIHEAVRFDGLVVIMDEAVADDFTAPGDPVEQAMYGYSTLICLPDGLSSTPSEGTGTVMRREILTDYASRAGFTSVQVLPIEEFGFWRFYRLLH
jgi:SAM-dependent methyltransferase